MNQKLASLTFLLLLTLAGASYAADAGDIASGNEGPGSRPFDDPGNTGTGSGGVSNENTNTGPGGGFNDPGAFDPGPGPGGDNNGGNPFPQQPDDPRFETFPSPGGNPSPTPGPVESGPSFPSPGNSFEPSAGSSGMTLPLPIPMEPALAAGGPRVADSTQPASYFQTSRDSGVSVYSQSSASSWTSGDPFNPAPPANATAVTGASSEYQPSMILMWTGKVINMGKGSVTIKDKNRSVKTFAVASGMLSGVEKGHMIQVGAVPGQTRAESLRKLS